MLSSASVATFCFSFVSKVPPVRDCSQRISQVILTCLASILGALSALQAGHPDLFRLPIWERDSRTMKRLRPDSSDHCSGCEKRTLQSIHIQTLHLSG
jgi:hypothetical protein